MDLPLAGTIDDAFAPVRDAFLENFASRGEVGAALAVSVDGDVVVDLVGGFADQARTMPYGLDTLVDVYSVGKAFLALLVLELVDEGTIDLDAPIAAYWPEFAAHGKAGATVRHGLCHRAGVPAIRQPLSDADLLDFDTMAAALAATQPWWEPGTRHAYHTNTYGHLLGELVHRATGEMPSDRLARLAARLDIGDQLYIGVPDEALARCAEVCFEASVDPARLSVEGLDEVAAMTMLSYFNPPGYSSYGVVNTTPWRQAEIPSTNTHATARGIAAVYAALLEQGRLLSPALLAEATRVQSAGPCPILGEDVAFGLGFVPTSARRRFGPHEGSFGHFGTGGAVGFADPTGRVAFGYAMNHVIPRWQSSRNRALIDALYDCL